MIEQEIDRASIIWVENVNLDSWKNHLREAFVAGAKWYRFKTKPLEVLLITEDGLEVTIPETKLWFVDTETWETESTIAALVTNIENIYNKAAGIIKWFSNPQARNAYVLANMGYTNKKLRS